VRDGRLQRREFVRSYYPIELDSERWTAIAWTTSSSVCAVIELVRDGKLPTAGYLKQEDIALADFVQTVNGARFDD